MESTPVCIPVRQINWSNENIHRAGVCPIFQILGHKFIGFGVSNYSSSISPLGGSFESSDFDLLDTAVREYNEEVERNYQNINLEDVLNNYAVINQSTFQIFLPISQPRNAFEKTQELFDMLWVTPAQLDIMNARQDYRFPGANFTIFYFGSRFIDMLSTISDCVNSGIAFEKSPGPLLYERKKKTLKSYDIKIVEGVSNLEYHLGLRDNFIGHTSVAFNENTIAIINKVKTLFLLPLTVEVLKMLNRIPTRIYVSFQEDVKYLERWVTPGKIRPISKSFSSRDEKMKEDFEREIVSIRRNNDLIEEVKVIEKYEEKIYEAKQQKPQQMTGFRAIILSCISYINDYLSHGPDHFIRVSAALDRFLDRKLGRRQLRGLPGAEEIIRELNHLKIFSINDKGVMSIPRPQESSTEEEIVSELGSLKIF